MRIQFDAQAIDLQAADLERTVSKDANRFASQPARYTRRGSLGLARLVVKPFKHGFHLLTLSPHTGHPVVGLRPMTRNLPMANSCRLPLLGLSGTWLNQLWLGQDAITG